MKYEIIKGSEKDFEGAPEWATMKCHCTVGDPSKITNMNVAFSDGVVRGSRWVATFEDGLEGVINREEQWHIIAERRPITEPVWDGEGLPPVGCHCEVKAGKDSWNLCKIVFSDDAAGVAFVYLGGDEEKYVGSVDCIGAVCAPSYFRPMRSPEDVARDEAKGVIAELCRSSASNGHSADLIYDAIAAGKIKGVKLEGK